MLPGSPDILPTDEAPKILITIKWHGTTARMKSWVMNLQFPFGWKQLSYAFFKSILIEWKSKGFGWWFHMISAPY